MNRRILYKSRLIPLTILLVVLANLVDIEWLRSNLWCIYLCQYVVLIAIVFSVRDRSLFMLSPSFVAVSYLSINNIVGALAFRYRIVYSEQAYLDFLGWRHLNMAASFVLLANLLVILPYFLAKGAEDLKRPDSNARPRTSGLEVTFVSIFTVSVFLVFSGVEVDLESLGGRGDFAIFPRTIAALGLILTLSAAKLRGRFFVYLLLLVYFASFSSHSKREALLLLLPIALVEGLVGDLFHLRVRSVLLFIGAAIVSFGLVLAMSIYRGYGNFTPEDFADSRNYVSEYMKDEQFYEYLLNNLEINYIFYHSHQAIEYALESPDLVLYGSTFAKIIFTPIPRVFYPGKPAGIVDRYTSHHAPLYRARGGSCAGSMLTEFFWNFHFIGLLGLFVVFSLGNWFYLALASKIRAGLNSSMLFPVFAYQQMMEVIRGSGFDVYFTYLLIGGLLILLCFRPVLSLLRRIGRRDTLGVSNPSGAMAGLLSSRENRYD